MLQSRHSVRIRLPRTRIALVHSARRGESHRDQRTAARSASSGSSAVGGNSGGLSRRQEGLRRSTGRRRHSDRTRQPSLPCAIRWPVFVLWNSGFSCAPSSAHARQPSSFPVHDRRRGGVRFCPTLARTTGRNRNRRARRGIPRRPRLIIVANTRDWGCDERSRGAWSAGRRGSDARPSLCAPTPHRGGLPAAAFLLLECSSGLAAAALLCGREEARRGCDCGGARSPAGSPLHRAPSRLAPACGCAVACGSASTRWQGDLAKQREERSGPRGRNADQTRKQGAEQGARSSRSLSGVF